MKVGFYSPLPPLRTGVADYGAALLNALRHHGSVEVAPAAADVFLYHLGNNRLHREIYSQAVQQPGVIVLHDAVLHHFFLGSLDQHSYVEEFIFNYGEWNRSLAEELWQRRASSGLDSCYFQYPMIKRIVERSLAVVVHNPGAARMVRDHATSTPVVEIPHLFQPEPLPAAADVLRFRQRLGIPAQGFVFGVFGYLREPKRLMATLRVFEEARRERRNLYLLIAGDFVSSDLERAVLKQLSGPGIIRLPYLGEDDFRLASAAVDACVNLRYPAAGESSGIAIRMMGIGKPVLLTAGLETSRFPEGACFRIDPGIAERAALSDYMLLLSASPRLAAEIGRRGAEYIARNHSLTRVAEMYWNTLCEYCR